MKRKLLSLMGMLAISGNMMLAQGGAINQNVTIGAYGTGGESSWDISIVKLIFGGTVTVNGTSMTADYQPDDATDDRTYFLPNFPTSVAGFGGVQVVMLGASGKILSQAQADAIVDYVKQGGVFVGNLLDSHVDTGSEAIIYIAKKLYCGNIDNITFGYRGTYTNGETPANPGNGTLLLTTGVTDNSGDNYVPGWYRGIPMESRVFYWKKTSSSSNDNDVAASDCANRRVTEFVVPAFPGMVGGPYNSCGVKGMALLTGTYGATGILGGFSYRNDSQNNKNYAQLIKDFLYGVNEMNTRRAWAATSSNVNTTCPTSSTTCTPPTAVSVSPATQSVNANSPATLTATATGATSYQWYSNTTNSTSGGTLITGATSATYSPVNTTPGTYYYYVVASSNGCTAVSTTGGSQVASQVTVTPCAAGGTGPVTN